MTRAAKYRIDNQCPKVVETADDFDKVEKYLLEMPPEYGVRTTIIYLGQSKIDVQEENFDTLKDAVHFFGDKYNAILNELKYTMLAVHRVSYSLPHFEVHCSDKEGVKIVAYVDLYNTDGSIIDIREYKE